MVGFAESALRGDHVNGCKSSPVIFLEGVFVRPEARRRGVARRLCAAVEAWGRSAGCKEFASDALLRNEASYDLHRALGFHDTERVVFFRKFLPPKWQPTTAGLDGSRPNARKLGNAATGHPPDPADGGAGPPLPLARYQ